MPGCDDHSDNEQLVTTNRMPALTRCIEQVPLQMFNFVDNGGLVLSNVDVRLIFWGQAWGQIPEPVPSVTQVRNAITTILTGTYMKALSQFRIKDKERIQSRPIGVSFKAQKNLVGMVL